jgi:hypothetical protein
MSNLPLIILTTTVSVQDKVYLFQTDKGERAQVYTKKIRQWLQETSFPIVVVENTGYTFPELEQEREIYKDRFEIISYMESELEEAAFLKGNPYKGASEVFAIHWAYHHSQFSVTAPFIIKITGRFFIPQLEIYLSGFSLENYDVLVQNRKNRCEMLGCRKDHFEHVFGTELINRHGNHDGNVEDVYQFRCEQYENIIHCPEFPIEGTQRGGINEVFYNI